MSAQSLLQLAMRPILVSSMSKVMTAALAHYRRRRSLEKEVQIVG